MRRFAPMPARARVLVAPVVALLLLLAPAAAASAAPSALVVAAEVEGGEIEAPEPRLPDAPDNEFAPDDYEANFLWGAAVGLFALTAVAFLVVGGLYWLLVKRPRENRQRA